VCHRRRGYSQHDRSCLFGDEQAPQDHGPFIAKLPDTNIYSLALGVGAIVLILAIRRFKPIIPGALVALTLGIPIASIFQLNANCGVSVAGDIPIGMPAPVFPLVPLEAIPLLIGGAAGIVFLAMSAANNSIRRSLMQTHVAEVHQANRPYRTTSKICDTTSI
jgi:MFS superfamily sulfate permease-like transporter